MRQRMKEPYGEGLATHPGLESCVESWYQAGEALTEERKPGY